MNNNSNKVPTKFRQVGFTDSWYEDGEPEVGYKGDFCESPAEAKEAGCGDNGFASGYEVRGYTDANEWVWTE